MSKGGWQNLTHTNESTTPLPLPQYDLNDETVKNITLLARQMRWIADTERHETLERLRARADAEDPVAIETLRGVANGTVQLNVQPDDEATASEARRALLVVRRQVRERFAALPES